MIGGRKRRNRGRALKSTAALLAACSSFVALAPAAYSSGTAVIATAPSPQTAAPHPETTSPAGDKHEPTGASADGTTACPSEPSPSKSSGRPLMVVVGASFTAGVGASSPTASWAYLLPGYLGWRAIVKGVPGAGYVRAGRHHRGPVGRLLAEADLSRAQPSLVVVQAGHDDIGEPLSLIAERETADLEAIRTEAPDARIAILSVFVRRGVKPSRRDVETDETIVATAEKVDPQAIIFNPIAGHWHFRRVHGGLHPDEGGDIWIARHVAEGLVAKGVTDFNSPACLTEGNSAAGDSSPQWVFGPGAPSAGWQ